MENLVEKTLKAIQKKFVYRRVTRGGREGRTPLPFFENWKKVP